MTYKTQSLRCLGIDPGLANCGSSVVSRNKSDKFTLMDAGVIRTQSSDTEAARVLSIYQKVSELLYVHAPNLLAAEKVYFNQNVSSAISTGGIGYICLLAAEQVGIESVSLRPQEIKAITGHPRASKQQVQRLVCRLTGVLLKNPHACDAAAAAIAGLLHRHRLGDV